MFGREILAALAQSGQEVVQICGPMTTGGLGSLEANMKRFAHAIDQARANGRQVFNQIPFQEVIIRVTDHHAGGAYRMDILTDFYRPLFESKLITCTLFLPGWEDSTGASQERVYAELVGIAIEEYPQEWLLDEA